MPKRGSLHLPELPAPRAGVSLSKIDAARRQLETAILLYFRDGDAVSIHTLAAAAHEILAAVNRKRGSEPMISDMVLEGIKLEYRDAFNDRVKEAQNFFKHGSRDPFATLTGFSTRQSEVLLIDACLAYGRITEDRPPVTRLFALWARLTFAKEWLSFPDESVLTTDPEMAAELAAMSKGNFFDRMLQAVYHADRWRLPAQ